MAVRADGTAGERAGIACIREREEEPFVRVDGSDDIRAFWANRVPKRFV